MSVIIPSVYAIDDDDKKELCEENGGDWEDGACDFETGDEYKADAYDDDLSDLKKFEEGKAALEDALCVDLEDSAKFDACRPSNDDDDEDDEDIEPNTKEEDEEFAKELCVSETYKGEWKDGECTNFPGGQSSASIGFGDECESSDFQKKHPYFCKVKE